MPDVGILNLQIHDDSAKAAEGLSKLVAKLEEMKDATSKIRLGTVATGIKRINDELSKVQPSAIYKLKQLADVLEKIGSISGNVGGIRISFGGRGQSAEDMAAQLQAARDAVAQTTAGFEQIGQRVQEDVQGAEAFANTMGRVNEIVQQTGWTAQATAEQFAQMFQVMNSIRMSGALGGGASPFALGDGTGGSGADWTEWKDGAIEVEGTVTDAMEAIGVGAGEAIPLLTGVVDATDEIASSVQEMANGSKSFINTAPGFNDVAQSVQSAADGVKRYYNSLEDAFNGIRNGRKIENDLMSKWLHGEGTENEKLYAVKTMATQFGMSTDDVRAKIAELMAAENGLSGAAQETTDAMNSINGAADEQKKSLKELIIGANGLNGAFKRMFPTLSGLLGRFSQLVKYRMLRAVIKQIAEGFREGTENYYRYSQAIGGEFATKMDNAATALLQMKNSIGAAAAPLINSLIPYLQMAVDWFINIVNYANQFVALLRGQTTWSRAVPKTTSAFDDQTKAAKKAGAAAKDLLADWDELNIIQSENGGGSGVAGISAAEDYLNMFEEVGKYENWVKDLVDNIKGQFGDIWGLVKRIGIAVLGWKISRAFAGILGTIAGLVGAGAITDLVFNVTTLLNKQYISTGEDGWLVANVLETILGAYLMKQILGNILDGSFAKLAIPLTLSISALADFTTMIGSTDVSAISEEALKLSALGALKSGVAAGYLAHLFGASLGTSIAGGAVASLITFGIAIGIKAVDRTVKGEITEETIKASALSSLAMGVGTGLFAKLVGASALASVGLGAAAAGFTILTIGAAIGIKAIITSQQKDMEWGNLTLTQEQVKSFVLNELFETGFNAKLELMKGTVEASDTAKADIQRQIEAIEIPVSKLKWKIDEANAVEELKKQVFGDDESGTTGLIGTFKKLAKEQENLVETSLTLVPIKGENGTDESGKFAAASLEGWDVLTQAMDDLGLELNRHLTASMNKNLTEEMRQYEKNAAVEIVETMARVSRAAASGLTSGQSEVKFSIGLESMSRESVGDAIKLYQEYIDNIKKEYVDLTTETAASFRSQAAAFAEFADSTQDAELKRYYQQKAKEYEDLFNEYKEKALHGVEESTKEDQAKGRALFVEWIQKTLQFTPEDFGKVTHPANPLSDYVKTLIGGLGITIRQNDGAYADALKDQFSNVLGGMLEALLSKEDYETIKSAIDAGLLNYTDIFQEDVIPQIIDYIGADSYYGQAIRTAWEQMLQDTIGNGAETPQYDNEVDLHTTVNETQEIVTENVDGVTSELPTGGQEAVEEYQAQAAALTATADEVEMNVNTLTLDNLTFDTTSAQTSASNAALAIENMASRIRAAFESLDGLGFEFSAGNAETVLEKMHAAIHVIPVAANGAVFKSGDIFSANENGRAELIGSYGNKTAVMNNDQVVGAVTSGVAQANSGVESRLGTIETLLTRILNKEFTARAVPSSAWGGHNVRSQEAYDKVTG